MSFPADSKKPIASKIAIVCALAVAANTFAGDVSYSTADEPASGLHGSVSRDAQQPDELAQIPVLFQMAEEMKTFFDRAYTSVLAGSVPHEALLKNPFGIVAENLGRALAEIKSLRGTDELGPYGDKLIYALAEARYKADRNFNLIRQIIAEPSPFVSSINRDGLIGLSKIARDPTNSFSS